MAQCWHLPVTDQPLSRCHSDWRALRQCWNSIGSWSTGGVSWLVKAVICCLNTKVWLAVNRGAGSVWAGGSGNDTRSRNSKGESWRVNHWMNVALHCMNVKHNDYDNTLTNFIWIWNGNKDYESALLVVFCGERFCGVVNFTLGIENIEFYVEIKII